MVLGRALDDLMSTPACTGQALSCGGWGAFAWQALWVICRFEPAGKYSCIVWCTSVDIFYICS